MLNQIEETAVATAVTASESETDEQSSVAELLQIVQEERRGRWGRAIRRGVLTWLAIVVLLLGLLALLGHIVWAGKVMGIVVMIAISTGSTAWMTDRQRAALKQLAEMDELRAVGPLLESWRFPHKVALDQTRTALLRLLPQMTAGDSHLLDEEQMKLLEGMLEADNTQKDPELVVAVLRALAQTGKPTALKSIDRIASGKGTLGKVECVRAAALDCGRAIRQRAQADEERARLLRIPNESDEGILLRAAVSEHTDDALLLRPGPEPLED